MPNVFDQAKLVTEAASGLVNGAVAYLGRREADGSETEKRNPVEMLNDIALDEELQREFAPVLSRLGFEINKEDTEDSLGDKRTITVARSNTEIAFYVACIPKLLLEEGSQVNRYAFASLEYLFEGNVAYIISRDLPYMDPDFEPLFTVWKSKLIYASFVPWNYVTKFLKETDDGKRAQLMKKSLLKLGEMRPSTPATPISAPTELTIAEREEVIELMADIAISAAYEEPRVFFKELASSAYLPGLETLELKGNARVSARQLFDYSTEKEYPDGHERARQPTLGWLLAAFAEKFGLAPRYEDRLIAVILKHNLIGEPKKLEELRRKMPNASTGGPS